MLCQKLKRSAHLIFSIILAFCRIENDTCKRQFFREKSPEKVVSLLVKFGFLIAPFFLLSVSVQDSFAGKFDSYPYEIYRNLKNTVPEDAGNALLLTLTATNVACNGGNNGSIASNLSGGSGGTVNYTITPGSATNTTGIFPNLIAGAYTVLANDGGITTSSSISITEPALQLSSSISAQINVGCKGNSTGSLTVSGNGGTTTYSYSKDAGVTYQGSGTFASLSAGSFTVKVKDANGCTVNQAATITEPATVLTSSITSQTNVACKGSSTGSLTVTGIGGTAIYIYSIDGGATFQASGTFGSLSVGSYTVKVKDANGCTVNQVVTITEPAILLGATITSQTNVSCKGGATGSVTVAGTGGTAVYQYSKNGGTTYQATGTFGALMAGVYTIRVKDANGCTFDQPITITEPALALGSSIVAQSNVLCKGGATGSVTISGTGGTTAYQYSKNGGTTYKASGTFGTLGAGVYTIRVKDANNCTFDQPVTISEPAVALNVTSSSNSPVCTNATLNLSATGTGGNGSYTYSWTGPNSFSSTSQNPSIVNPTTAASGNYTVTVKDANNCTAISIVSVTINAAPTVMVNASINSICAGGSVTLTSSSNIPPTVSWSSNPAGFSSSVANPPTVNPNVTTTYTATYTNPATGCSNSASTAVTVNPSPVITIQPNYCAVPGKVRLTASGGTTYTWTTGETTNPIFTDVANTYGVSSTNAFGCTGSAFLPVANELVTNGDFSAGNTGFSSTYGYVPVSTNALWPEGLYGVGPNPTAYHSNFWGRDHTTNSGNFMIVNGTGLAGVVVWQETVTVLPNTPYYFSAWAMSLNSVPPYANLQFKVNGTLVGTTAPLAARPANNNPPYNWQRFYGNWNSGAATTAVIQIVDLQTALGGNDFGLDDVSYGTLAAIPFTIAPTVNPTATACSGKTMYLKANITGGKAPITYSWTGPNGFTSALKDPVIPNASVVHSGLYTLTVVDGYGCIPVIGTTNATILPSPAPLISSISGSGIVCPSSLEKYWTPPQSNVTSSWGVTGGSIIGSSVKDSVNIQWSASGNGIITLKSTNTVNLCDSTVTKTVLIQDLIPPVINCPASLNLSGCDETALTVNPYSATEVTIPLSQLTLAGGSASDNCALASITYKDTKSGINPVVVTRTYSAYDFAGNKSSCNQIINIKDNTPPSLVVPASFGFCVEDLISAAIVSSLLQLNPTPDYFLFKKGSNTLDVNPVNFSDNCTPANQLVLHWTIDFSSTAPTPSISGTGQPSAYVSDINFPGDGATFLDVTHTITYWMTDLAGNESVHKAVVITIHPRPELSYHNQSNSSECTFFSLWWDEARKT